MWRSGLLIGLLVFGTDQLLADDAAAWQALREGRAVLIMRHASAPGLGDPEGFVLEDCKTQRNLNQQGREEAQRWGVRLREAGLGKVRLFSSRWCRALETADQMTLGSVEPLPALDSFFASPANKQSHTAALREAVEQLQADEVAVLVTHQVNITALTGIFPQSGEGLILERPLTTPPKVLTRIAPP